MLPERTYYSIIKTCQELGLIGKNIEVEKF